MKMKKVSKKNNIYVEMFIKNGNEKRGSRNVDSFSLDLKYY